MNLYSTHAEEFSKTRQLSWAGWEKTLDLYKDKKINVLDLGCGNGRFLKFLLNHNIQIESYTGIDNSEVLLNIFKKEIINAKYKNKCLNVIWKMPERKDPNLIAQNSPHLPYLPSGTAAGSKRIDCKLINADLNTPNWVESLNTPFDLVVCFGLMHHLKNSKSRVTILNNSKKHLKTDGLIIVSFWQFLDFDRTKNKIIEDLGDNNFYLSFGTNGAKRFCHYSNPQEAKDIVKNAGLKIKTDYFDDGENGKLNYYLILKN